ncbi:LysR family transcriptional regulator [Polaromonas sp. JS666]|uniref:LysR family transcriptional regulator n=1 Tax=Polaromonas sp. (strain JS666 / ATCC BAA-500) TaxID=296591 RepID=UPI0000463D37|nr:LysR family transcriptional regulator [Polaromonas sp. JS666]ABE46692.1 transcriptional regulator, LysR family [Polaromonas sp. JS666]
MSSDTTDLRFFVTLTESGALAEAARRMDVTASAVSQRLRQLENRLGVQLVQRSTRRFSLTDEGELFYTKALTLLAELDALIDSLRARSGEVAGTLHVRGPLGFGRQHLAGALADFHSQHPKLVVALTLSDVPPAADADRFDLIVHIGDLANSSMVAYPIAPNTRILCASPDYLARHAPPQRPEDLTGHQCLVLRENEEDVSLWRFRKGRTDAAVRIAPAMSSNDGDVTRQWALAGKGIIMRSEWDVAEHLAAGRLVRLLDGWRLPDADIVALIPQRHGVSARVKLFLAFLQARFQPVPPWRKAARVG